MNAPLSIPLLAKMIDHSLLHPTLTDAEVRQGCELALKYDVATACVKPYSVKMAAEILSGSNVAVCPVIGFPHGNSTTEIKIAEARAVIADGGREVDMVINIGKALGGDWNYVSDEIGRINQAVVNDRALLKVIFENDYLQTTHIIRLCQICSEHQVAFVKTSTGYGFVKQANGMYSYKGATMEHLKLMRQHCPPSVQIKAAGGIRTLDDLLAVRAIGVTRIGATATQAILEEAKKRGITEAPGPLPSSTPTMLSEAGGY
ncbi:MAG: deoxyribose-phosphate aldolase [Verrucomicrobiota bacterium]